MGQIEREREREKQTIWRDCGGLWISITSELQRDNATYFTRLLEDCMNSTTYSPTTLLTVVFFTWKRNLIFVVFCNLICLLVLPSSYRPISV